MDRTSIFRRLAPRCEARDASIVVFRDECRLSSFDICSVPRVFAGRDKLKYLRVQLRTGTDILLVFYRLVHPHDFLIYSPRVMSASFDR